MEKLAFLFVPTILACLPRFLFGLGDIPDPHFIRRDIYCIGCEYSVKTLHKIIQRESSSGNKDKLDVIVAEALLSLCSEEYFSGSEISAKELLKGCEFLIEENGSILDPLLVTHFSRTTGGSYLDLSQQVCMDLSKACLGVDKDKRYPDHLDSDLEYDAESNTFRVKHGRNLRMPEPMRAKDDL